MENYLCIDIGGTYIKYAIASTEGKILFKKKIVTPSNLNDFLSSIKTIVAECVSPLKGIGISSPGKIDNEHGTIYHGGSVTYLNNLSLKEILEREFGVATALINDGKAAVLAEHWLGNLKGVSNGVALVLGTAVGGGIISDGRLVSGAHFQAAEFSFMLHRNNKNHVNQLLGDALSGVDFIVRGSRLLGLSSADGQLVFQAIEERNKQQIAHFKKYCHEIACLILNIQAVLDSERVVIGGGISSQPQLIDEINHQVDKIRAALPSLERTMIKPVILPCKFGNDANLLGALYQCLDIN